MSGHRRIGRKKGGREDTYCLDGNAEGGREGGVEWRVCCHCSSCSTAPHGWTCCRSPESELSPQVEAEMDGGGGLDGAEEEERGTNPPLQTIA